MGKWKGMIYLNINLLCTAKFESSRLAFIFSKENMLEFKEKLKVYDKLNGIGVGITQKKTNMKFFMSLDKKNEMDTTHQKFNSQQK